MSKDKITLKCGCEIDDPIKKHSTPEPTLQEQLEEIIRHYELDARDDTPYPIHSKLEALILSLIEKAERKARLEELNNLYDEAETPEQYDTCDVVHDHRIAERIKELSDKGVDNDRILCKEQHSLPKQHSYRHSRES